MGQYRPFFSIVIPTYHRPQQLAACLQTLTHLDYPRDRFEVIVVDDGGEISLDGVLALFKEVLCITLLRQPHAGPAGARNVGAATAKGDFIAFTADDCGTLIAAHRFKPLAEPLDLPVGAYTIVAVGFSENNRNMNFGVPGADAPWQFEALAGAIRPVGASRHSDGQALREFPRSMDYGPIQYVAGSFEYALEENAGRDPSR